MPSPLLSTYRTGENRITSSTMAVFERIDLALVQELLESASGIGEELRSVTFSNQVVSDGSVPDARISARFTWYFETKTTRGAYASEGHGRKQVRCHSKQLHGDPDAKLFVLTPDSVQPAWFDSLDGVEEPVRNRIIWLSFLSLAEVIRALIGDTGRLVGEQTRFLLAELVALYEADGLLSSDDTVVVAAKVAWGEYQKYAAYVCQPNRSFREGLTHFGFYFKSHIQDRVPKIIEWVPSVLFAEDAAAGYAASGKEALATVIRSMLGDQLRVEGDSHGVMLLSPERDPRTVYLRAPIANDTTTEAGKAWAWTLGQRYTSLSRLKSGVTLTSQL
ncbi:hypothetical protein O7632_07295 [Solwaraspora sp. WMMD406]|uniref:hypothetical protein n=1 Tax=Solwaraspora sp. WMMD406 TaxID=3016095 RepID=UPI0024167A45|nr:hypothetical protein [Solwaraspora sp. WMMD406]MDG4763914.1 hypothetical protein [Solwaraspora sp. WMMD406]